MYYLKNIFVFVSVGVIQASIFDLKFIGDEDVIRMPNIYASGSSSRPIGATPPPTLSTSQQLSYKPALLFLNPPDISNSAESEATGDRIVKRSRNDVHVLESDLEKYIKAEIKCFNGFTKPEKKIALRTVIELIAHNDYEGFLAYEPAFEIAFKHKYHMFRRGTHRILYMPHYIIRFGATNFLESHAYTWRPSYDAPNISSAFEHLISTKPLETLIVFIKKSRQFRCSEVVKAICAAVQKHHPDFHFLDYTIFEADFNGCLAAQFDLALKIYESRIESEKLRHTTAFLIYLTKYVSVFHISQARFMEIPFRYEEYFMSLSIDLKYHIAKLAIVNGDLDKLTRIIELVPDLAVHTSKENLFSVAVDYNKPNIVQFFLDIVPELVSLETEKSTSPFGLALELEKLEILKVFEVFGVDFTEEIRFRRNLFTPLRLALEFKKPKTFQFLLNRFGVGNVSDQLMQAYGSRNEIMKVAMRPEVNFNLVKILRDLLGFDLNDEYTFGEKRGNVMIFFDKEDYYYIKFKSDLGIQ